MEPKVEPQPNQQILTRATKEGNFITMSVGAYSYAVNFSYWLPKSRTHVMIGNYCSLARQLAFNIGRNHNFKNVTTYPNSLIKKFFQKEIKSPYYKNPFQIIIGSDVWIGQSVTIMGGVKIGNGALIGANSVVAKDIPPYAIVVGNPARVIKYRFDEETIKKLLAVKWWNWDAKKIADNLPLMNDVEKFLELHYSPELDAFPEDDISRRLSMWGGGYLPLYCRLSGANSAVV